MKTGIKTGIINSYFFLWVVFWAKVYASTSSKFYFRSYLEPDSYAPLYKFSVLLTACENYSPVLCHNKINRSKHYLLSAVANKPVKCDKRLCNFILFVFQYITHSDDSMYPVALKSLYLLCPYIVNIDIYKIGPSVKANPQTASAILHGPTTLFLFTRRYSQQGHILFTVRVISCPALLHNLLTVIIHHLQGRRHCMLIPEETTLVFSNQCTNSYLVILRNANGLIE